MKYFCKIYIYNNNCVDYFSHFRSLLINSNFNLKWNNKVLKWTISIVLFGLLLLGAIYIVHIFFKNELQPDFSANIKVSYTV